MVDETGGVVVDDSQLIDVKSTLATIRGDLRHKQAKLKQIEEKEIKDLTDSCKIISLAAEIKGITEVLEDLEPIIYGN